MSYGRARREHFDQAVSAGDCTPPPEDGITTAVEAVTCGDCTRSPAWIAEAKAELRRMSRALHPTCVAPNCPQSMSWNGGPDIEHPMTPQCPGWNAAQRWLATAQGSPERTVHTRFGKPRYTHDCEACRFLGHWRGSDLYYCNASGQPTVIARDSSEPGSYESGMDFARSSAALAIAYVRAIHNGYTMSPGGQNGATS